MSSPGNNKENGGERRRAKKEGREKERREKEVGYTGSTQPSRLRIFLDSQPAIKRLKHTEPEAGQALAIRARKAAQELVNQGREVTVQWVPGHKDIEGNERADQAAKRATEKSPRNAQGRLSL
jgi:ribonuclease HI